MDIEHSIATHVNTDIEHSIVTPVNTDIEHSTTHNTSLSWFIDKGCHLVVKHL